MAFKPTLLIETLRSNIFTLARYGILQEKNKIQLFSLGALTAEAFYRCVYQNDLDKTTKLIKVLTNKFKKS